ncbi:hypothetical protein V6N13_107458 [Hibiscus sabdariffa]
MIVNQNPFPQFSSFCFSRLFFLSRKSHGRRRGVQRSLHRRSQAFHFRCSASVQPAISAACLIPIFNLKTEVLFREDDIDQAKRPCFVAGRYLQVSLVLGIGVSAQVSYLRDVQTRPLGFGQDLLSEFVSCRASQLSWWVGDCPQPVRSGGDRCLSPSIQVTYHYIIIFIILYLLYVAKFMKDYELN